MCAAAAGGSEATDWWAVRLIGRPKVPDDGHPYRAMSAAEGQ